MRTGMGGSIAARRRAARTALVVALMVSVAAACDRTARTAPPSASARITSSARVTRPVAALSVQVVRDAVIPFSSVQITRDATDSFTVTDQTGNTPSATLGTRAASVTGLHTNVGHNSRFVFANSWSTSRDQQSCATVASDTTPVDQEGVALRITTRPDGRARAIVFAKNVYFGVTAVFNVYGMDGGSAPVPFVKFGFHDYRNLEAGRILLRPPYAMCARVVGNVFTGKVWHPDRTTEPTWDDPTATFTLTLPAAWVGAGSAGYYFGHVRADDTVTYTNMSASMASR